MIAKEKKNIWQQRWVAIFTHFLQIYTKFYTTIVFSGLNKFVDTKQKAESKELLTSAGVIIDAKVTSVTNTHEGSWRVYTHGVLSAVVLSFSTLINIYNPTLNHQYL